MLNVRSVQREQTARSAIRDAALRLFADSGINGVSVRQIASAAELSPALVLPHFGSKDGLREAVDEHVIAKVTALAEEYSPQDVERVFAGDSEPAVAALSAAFPPDSPELAYMARLLVEGGEAGQRLYLHWHEYTVNALRQWESAGLISAGPDPEARAAFMLTADFGLMVLRSHVAAALGSDPMGEGLGRWTQEVVRIYGGLFTGVQHPDAPTPQGADDD